MVLDFAGAMGRYRNLFKVELGIKKEEFVN